MNNKKEIHDELMNSLNMFTLQEIIETHLCSSTGEPEAYEYVRYGTIKLIQEVEQDLNLITDEILQMKDIE